MYPKVHHRVDDDPQGSHKDDGVEEHPPHCPPQQGGNVTTGEARPGRGGEGGKGKRGKGTITQSHMARLNQKTGKVYDKCNILRSR